MEYKVTITKTQKCEIILKAEEDEDIYEIVNTAIEEKAVAFNDMPTYQIGVKQLGE